MKKQAFTLVELIVVITILAILATIGFVSFSGYLAGTRDTNRIAQLKSMSDALELYRTKKDLPIPDDKVDVQASRTTIAYQGYIGANVLETIEYTEKGLDPKDKVYFSYYLTKNKKYFQLLGFLEETNTDVVTGIFESSQAVDYSGRYPKTQGKKLGILTDSNNTPIQEISAITSSGYLDIATTTDTYNAILDYNIIVTGTGSKLAIIESVSNNGGKILKDCNSILADNSQYKNKDGIYIINPIGNEIVEVNCDMTLDGGGWTLFTAKAKYGYPDVGVLSTNDVLNENDYEYIRWDYVSPSGTKLPLIYKMFHPDESKVLFSNGNVINKDQWDNDVEHYKNPFDFSQAFSIGEDNSSTVTENNIKNAVNNDGRSFFWAWTSGTPTKYSIGMGTAWPWSSLELNDYIRFPATPYSATYRIGVDTFPYISNSFSWNDGRSISIWVK